MKKTCGIPIPWYLFYFIIQFKYYLLYELHTLYIFNNIYFLQSQQSYKTVNVVTQEVFERLIPKAPKRVNQVPPPPPPSLTVDHLTEVMESTGKKVILVSNNTSFLKIIIVTFFLIFIVFLNRNMIINQKKCKLQHKLKLKLNLIYKNQIDVISMVI